jgi:hypothetical protein
MKTKKKKQAREIYVGCRMTKEEKAAGMKRHKIKGRNASKMLRLLWLSGSITKQGE